MAPRLYRTAFWFLIALALLCVQGSAAVHGGHCLSEHCCLLCHAGTTVVLPPHAAAAAAQPPVAVFWLAAPVASAPLCEVSHPADFSRPPPIA
jgi:hypothetical protein